MTKWIKGLDQKDWMMKSIALVSIMATIEEIVNEVKCLPISAYQCQKQIKD